MRQRTGRQERKTRQAQNHREDEPRGGWEPIPLHVELYIERPPVKREPDSDSSESSSRVIIIDLA
jgi:hypothetical protein